MEMTNTREKKDEGIQRASHNHNTQRKKTMQMNKELN